MEIKMILRNRLICIAVLLLLTFSTHYVDSSKSGSGFASVVKNVLRSPNKTTTASPKNPEHFRIIGGVETARNEFPFIVSLARHGGHFCGGSIIDPEWVLTAAHCASEPDFTVTAGEHNLDINEGTEQKSRATMVIRHPHYNPITYEDDICLVKVAPPFQYDRYVQPFAIPTAHYVATGNATVSGWGTEDEFIQLVSPVLRKVTVPLVDNMDCAKQYGHFFIPRKMLCAGLEEGGKDACQGDSGGPLQCDDYHKGVTLCGVVSFGLGCARPELAGVYTKVTYYRDWMEFEMRKNSGGNFNPVKRTTPYIRRHETTTTKTTTALPVQPPLPPAIPPRPGYTVVIIKPENGSYPPYPPPPPYYNYDRERPHKTRKSGGVKLYHFSPFIMGILVSLIFVF